MKACELAVLVLRLLAVYCFVEAVPQLGEFVQIVLVTLKHAVRDGAESGGWTIEMAVASLFPTTALVVVGLCLLWFSTPLGRRLAGSASDEVVTSRWGAGEAQSAAFAVAGVVVVAMAAPGLFFAAAQATRMSGDEAAAAFAPQALHDAWMRLIGRTLQLAIGVGLFFGSRGLSLMWRRLRTAGT